MALTVTESQAVFTVLHWLGLSIIDNAVPTTTADDAINALALLGLHAGKTLQISVRPLDVAAAVEKMAGRLAGAESDGHAQAVCRAIGDHIAHGGNLPWPSIRNPYDAWSHVHEAVNQ